MLHLRDAMAFTCYHCGTSTEADLPLPIHCNCGTSHYVASDPAVERTWQESRNARAAICHQCDQFNGRHCRHAIGSCFSSRHASWLRQVHEGDCPRDKWSGLTAADVRRVTASAYRHQPVPQQPLVIVSTFSPAIHRTNLIYHVCPLKANDVWRANVRQLVRRWGVFSGRKIVAVSQGDGCHDLAEVQGECRHGDIEWLPIENDKDLREVATFLPLLEAIFSTEPLEATFYAHTKGNSTADNALGAEYWRNQMYRSLLDDVHAVRHNLLQHPAVGTTLMHWPDGTRPPYPTALAHGNWMFAGTFFWFRHDAVFSHPQWRSVPRDRYGAEAWLSGMFRYDEVCTLWQPWPVDQYPTPSPYDPRLYQYPIRD